MTPTLFGPHFDRLGDANVVLSARARSYSVRGFPGPFSVKSVGRGEATWGVGGQRFTVDATACLIVGPGETYDMSIEAAQPVETFVVFFADDLISDVATTRLAPLEALLEAGGRRTPATLPITRRLWPADTVLARSMRRLRRVDRSAGGATDQAMRGVLDACADLAVEVRAEAQRIGAAKATTRAELHRRVVRGLAYIDDTICDPYDLDAAAGEACLSPHHFHRTFAAAFGRSPYAYVADRRIARAKRLLAEEQVDVAEVCAAVGYESLPSFTRRFRRSVGLSPAAWRAEVRKRG